MATEDLSNIRPSAIAGTWYPGDPALLRRVVSGYLESAERIASAGRPIAIVSPHAGYSYSGPTAGQAYAQLERGYYERAIVLGPLHRPVAGPRGAILAPAESAYRTPLGDLAIDHGVIERIAGECDVDLVRRDQEHSIEIQLPFLQVALGEIRIVPLMIAFDLRGSAAYATTDALAHAIASVASERTLIVVSTDLSHLDDHSEVVRTDSRLIELVRRFETDGLFEALSRGEVNACGGAGLVAALAAARQLGASSTKVLAYTTSGDVTGDTRPGTYTVGYMAALVA